MPVLIVFFNYGIFLPILRELLPESNLTDEYLSLREHLEQLKYRALVA